MEILDIINVSGYTGETSGDIAGETIYDSTVEMS